jgi:hypothetical protein
MVVMMMMMMMMIFWVVAPCRSQCTGETYCRHLQCGPGNVTLSFRFDDGYDVIGSSNKDTSSQISNKIFGLYIGIRILFGTFGIQFLTVEVVLISVVSISCNNYGTNNFNFQMSSTTHKNVITLYVFTYSVMYVLIGREFISQPLFGFTFILFLLLLRSHWRSPTRSTKSSRVKPVTGLWEKLFLVPLSDPDV